VLECIVMLDACHFVKAWTSITYDRSKHTIRLPVVVLGCITVSWVSPCRFYSSHSASTRPWMCAIISSAHQFIFIPDPFPNNTSPLCSEEPVTLHLGACFILTHGIT